MKPPGSPPKRPPGRPRGFDRDAALVTAMRTFWAHGYETTSISDLTAAMGIKAPALYGAFGDKRRLFLEALARYRGDPGFEAAAIRDAPSSRAAAALLLSSAIERFTGQDTPKGCLIASSLATGSSDVADLRQQGTLIRAQVELCLRERIERDVLDGALPDDTDPAVLAGAVICMVQGFSTLARDGAPAKMLRGIGDFLLRSWPDGQPSRRPSDPFGSDLE